MTSDILKRAAEAQAESKAYFEANGIVVTNPGLVPELIAEIERLTARAEAAEAREAALLAANDVNRKLMLERNAEVDRYGKRIDKLRADLANAGAVMVEAAARDFEEKAMKSASKLENLKPFVDDFESGCLHAAARVWKEAVSRIRALSALSPIAAAARVLLANTEAENDPEIGPWLRALAEQEKSDD